MRSTLLKNKPVVLLLTFALLIVVGVQVYLNDASQTITSLLVVSVSVFFFYLVFFQLKWYYLLLVALIPYSTDVMVAGGAKFSFPSEGMLVAVLPLLFLFNKNYWKIVNRILTHPLTLLLLIDLLLQLLTSLTGTEVEVSLKRVFIRFLFVSGFYVMVNVFSEKKQLIYPWIAYAAGLVPVMYFVLNMHASYQFNPRVVFSISRPYYDDHTIYGACLAFILPILVIIVAKFRSFQLEKKHQIGLGLVTLIVLISEFLALSRAAILSVVVAAMFYLLLEFKVKFKSLLILMISFVLIAYQFKDVAMEKIEQTEAVSNDGEIANHFSSVTNLDTDASNLERINRWICAIRMFEERPFLGFGPGTYQFEYNKFQTLSNKTYISSNSGDRGNAHSEYLTYLSETGIFGFIIFVLTVFAAIYFGMQNHYAVEDPFLKWLNLGMLLGLITFYFHGVFNMFIDQSKMSFLYFTALGTIVWINQRLNEYSDVEQV